jgi:two-component system, OmpR family, sensor histidine kinase QseC
MSLQRRLLLFLLIAAPLVWLVALVVSLRLARHEVDELYDTELIRLARQASLIVTPSSTAGTVLAPGDRGDADLRELAIAAWARDGHLLWSDREGVRLPFLPEAAGFVDTRIDGSAWRIYYLHPAGQDWLVAAGQKAHERDELTRNITLGQVLPWVLMLPVLLLAMTWAVKRAVAPLHALSGELRARGADDLKPLGEAQTAAELRPLVHAMNGLFTRIEATLARERRFTADAAHELRTPLATLRAQWDVLRGATPGPARSEAEARLGQGLERLDRLVTQMLMLSRLEAGGALPSRQPVRWPGIVEQAMSDCLALAERRQIELSCDWPEPEAGAALPIDGDEALLTVLLRNLLDNAVRYATPGTAVQLRFGPRQLEVDNDAQPLDAEQIARLGERFHRPDGNDEIGSGLGLSIVRRIAALHGLQVDIAARDGGRGLRVRVGLDAAA